jgi:hypothetical protein
MNINFALRIGISDIFYGEMKPLAYNGLSLDETRATVTLRDDLQTTQEKKQGLQVAKPWSQQRNACCE